MDANNVTGSWNGSMTTTEFPSGIRPPVWGDNSTLPLGPGLFVSVGLPLVLLAVGVLVFSSAAFIYFRIMERAESKWRRLEEDTEENKHDYLVKRRNSLVKRLKMYKRKSRDSGWDGCGGDSSSFDYPQGDEPEWGKVGPMRASAIEDETAAHEDKYHIKHEKTMLDDDVIGRHRPVAYVRPERRLASEETDDTDDEMDGKLKKAVSASLIQAEVHSLGSQRHLMSSGDRRSTHSEAWSMNNFLEERMQHQNPRRAPSASDGTSTRPSGLRAAKSVDNVFMHSQPRSGRMAVFDPDSDHQGRAARMQTNRRQAKSMENLFYGYSDHAPVPAFNLNNGRRSQSSRPDPNLQRAVSVQELHFQAPSNPNRSRDLDSSRIGNAPEVMRPNRKSISMQNLSSVSSGSSSRGPALQPVEFSDDLSYGANGHRASAADVHRAVPAAETVQGPQPTSAPYPTYESAQEQYLLNYAMASNHSRPTSRNTKPAPYIYDPLGETGV